MYENYLLLSKRFLLSVHTLTVTHQKALDTFCYKFLKKWAGVPKSVTNVVLHSKHSLNIKSISNTYMKAHSGALAQTRILSDSAVNAMISS